MQLAETLAELTPGDLSRVFFCSGGSEAVETALKIAKQVQALRGFPKRYKVIARRGSYHGATYGAMSLTTGNRPQVERFFGPLMAEVESKLRQEHGARYDQKLFEQYLMGYTMRTDRYRFTIWVDRRAPESEPFAVELYDHERDPRETVNIAGRPENQGLVTQLRAQWLAAH